MHFKLNLDKQIQKKSSKCERDSQLFILPLPLICCAVNTHSAYRYLVFYYSTTLFAMLVEDGAMYCRSCLFAYHNFVVVVVHYCPWEKDSAHGRQPTKWSYATDLWLFVDRLASAPESELNSASTSPSFPSIIDGFRITITPVGLIEC